MPLTKFTCFHFLVLAIATLSQAFAHLEVGYYKSRCFLAESIVKSTLAAAFIHDPSVAPGLLRMHFHDCFVDGCDASILLDGEEGEKAAVPNLSLHGFEVIDAAKEAVEAVCPGKVSCADILAFAARDSVVLTGGISWEVPGGRLDGLVSLKSNPLKFLPPPFANASELITRFAAQGLSKDDMITLSGAHTIGVSHCASFINRLYKFDTSASVDPSMNADFANELKQKCPLGNPNPNTKVTMDSPKFSFLPINFFDNSYYSNLVKHKGLFTSDQSLFTNNQTQALVLDYFDDNVLFKKKFGEAMIKMSSIGIKNNTQGQVRKNCRLVNV